MPKKKATKKIDDLFDTAEKAHGADIIENEKEAENA